ncbi:GGDEF domain-containing protein [Ideonella livida]|uniref:diguanylate cyclase n=1 Tax=Ideonella livida TaxID=2707176 RepID=A0A7C9PKJ4_9BURK|nr:GGDEF domain-containing protein [Ideonella livida]NDY93354.1 GGDEF domain-containing protein [Ideonella livida]
MQDSMSSGVAVHGHWGMALARLLARWGWRSAWFFNAMVAVGVGLLVAVVVRLLDGATWAGAALAGALAMVPAAVAGGVTLHLARLLAQTSRAPDVMGVEEEQENVHSRRQFMRLADREWSRCRRYGDDGALLLIDADHMRRLNDTMGQRCGDAVLQEIVRRVGATMRQSDILAKFSGAEAAVFLPHTDPLGALDAAERIRQQVASQPFRWDDAHIVATVSVGVAHVHAGQLSLDGLIHDAEAALTMAKEAGRNCVRAAPIQPRHNDASSHPMSPPVK